MTKKDLTLIAVAILLTGTVLLVGAKGDLLKNKLGFKKPSISSKSEKLSKAGQSEQNEVPDDEINHNYGTSSENILVSAPQPNEIIKGTAFTIRGQARVFENVVSIKIKDKNSVNLWVATTTLAETLDIGQFGSFKTEVDVKPYSGWAILEVFSSFAKDGSPINLVSFPIKISPSL